MLLTVLRFARVPFVASPEYLCKSLPDCDSFWGCFVNPFYHKIDQEDITMIQKYCNNSGIYVCALNRAYMQFFNIF